MRTSQYYIATVKETPSNAEVVSHQLMLRAGMIRRLASGLYSWLPLGLRVVQKIENIVREEMNAAGAMEVLMPAVQPAELWQESERWEFYGPELLRLVDRHKRDFCFGPTHEEVITDLVRRDLKSYKQLPMTLYQVQTKFRDEIRPRFGVMRAREFIMKDAYSFHETADSLDDTYQRMYQAYSNIFDRIGLEYRAVLADTGAIGGEHSHEFHVLAKSGEDAIAFSDTSQYAANVELAPSMVKDTARASGSQQMASVDTPKQRTIEEVSAFLEVPTSSIIKTLIVRGTESPMVALVIKGDDELNVTKAQKLEQVASPVEFVSEDDITKHLGVSVGSLGPVGLDCPVLVDHSAALLTDFVCGANSEDKHLTGVNWGRDCCEPEFVVDIRNVKEGDPSPDGEGSLDIARGIEVGHIFKLGTKYSEKMQTKVQSQEGKSTAVTMGCYGIGITRIAAAAIEQNNDEAGILWPDAIAPFHVSLLPMNYHKSYRVREVTEQLYQELTALGYEVLLEDRKERAGVLFSDHDLMGIPHRVVIGERGIDNGTLEYKARSASEKEDIRVDELVAFLQERLNIHGK